MSICIPFMLLVYALTRLSAQGLASTTTWSNSSNSFSAARASTSLDCELPFTPGSCWVIIHGPTTIEFLPTTYTRVAVTKILTIDRGLGEAHTSTRFENNNSSFTVPPSDLDKYRFPYADPIADTVVAKFGTSLYWPTNYFILPYSDITVYRAIKSLDSDGNAVCDLTSFQATRTMKSTKEADQYFFTTAPSNYNQTNADLYIQPDWPIFQEIGLDRSLNCSGVGFGEPTFNVPVLALTVTSTVLQSDAAPTEPGLTTRSRPSVPFTTNPPSDPAQTDPPTERKSSSTSSTNQSKSPSPVQNSIPPEISKTPKPSAVLTFDGSPVIPDKQGTYKIGTNILSPGGPPITVSEIIVSLAPSATALIIGSSTVSLPKNASPTQGQVITIAEQLLTDDTQGNYLIAGQTIHPGDPSINIGGTPLSLFPSATAIAVGSSTIPLLGNTVPPNRPEITVAGTPLTANTQGAYIFGTQTLLPGGSAIKISGTPYSLFPSATALFVGSSTAYPHSSPTITINGHPITPNLQGEYIIAGQTLTPAGPPITISGTPYSLFPSATALLVGDGSSTVPLSPRSSPTLTIAGQTLTPNPQQGGYLVNDQNLVPGGPPITISGTPYSLFPSATALVVGGSSTIPLPTGDEGGGGGVGGLIWSGIGGTSVSGNSNSGVNGTASAEPADGRSGPAVGSAATGVVQVTSGAAPRPFFYIDVVGGICRSKALACIIGAVMISSVSVGF